MSLNSMSKSISIKSAILRKMLTKKTHSSSKSTDPTDTHSSTSSQSEQLPKLSSTNTLARFPTWLYKAESLFTAKGLIDVATHPILLDGEEPKPNTIYLTDNHNDAEVKRIRLRSIKAHNVIIQALEDTQLNLILTVPLGHAFEALQRRNSHTDLLSPQHMLSLLSNNYKITKNRQMSL